MMSLRRPATRPSVRFDSDDDAASPPQAHPHVRALDGLRGVAILMVIIPHLASSGLLPGPAAVQHVAATIAHGVDLFFVLSGFGLAFPLLEQWYARNGGPVRLDLLAYAFNRIYRIMPAYYIAIAVTFVIAHFAAATGRLKPDDLLFVPHTAYQFVAPLLLLDRANLPINPNLWTIALQMRWYALFPLMLYLWLKSPRGFGLLLGCAWIGYLFTRERSIDLGALPLFLLGIIAADLIVRRSSVARFAGLAFPIALVAALAWDPHAMVQDPWGAEVHFIGQPTSLPWHIVAFSLVVLAATLRPLRALLACAPLVALGRASFSIYLMHQPIIALVLAKFGPHAGALAAVALLGAGFAFWACVERPLTNARVRRALRERCVTASAAIFAWCGIPRTVMYTGASD